MTSTTQRRPTDRSAAPATGRTQEPARAAPPDDSPRAATAYFMRLRPILESAVAARVAWTRELHDWRGRGVAGSRGGSAAQAAVGRAQQFGQARRQIAAAAAPPACRAVHRALDGWLAALAHSCAAVADAPQPLSLRAVDEAIKRMRAADRAADGFNTARMRLLGMLQDDNAASRGAAPFRLDRRTGIIAAVALALTLLILALAWMLTSAEPDTAAPGETRRVYTRPEVLAKLQQEIARRGVVFAEPDVRLVEPDRVIVTGKIPASEVPVPSLVMGSTPLVDVGVELRIAAEGGEPKITPLTMTAGGVTLPAWPFDALTLRAEEGNRELARQTPPTEAVRRLYIEPNQIVAELDRVAP